MKKIILLVLVLILATSFKIAELLEGKEGKKGQFSRKPVVGFSNHTDSTVTKEQMNTVINIINAASGFYKSDVKANIKYIKQNLDQLYSTNGQYFFVFIQTEKKVKSVWDMTSGVNFIVALEEVNVINPDWSYFLFRLQTSKQISDYAFVQKGVVGPGIGWQMASEIYMFISNSEPSGTCSCDGQSVVKIQYSIQGLYKGQWGIICDAKGVTQGLVSSKTGAWGTFNKNCYYTVFSYK